MTFLRSIVKSMGFQVTRLWKPYGRLFLLSDSPHWVISWEMKEIEAVARRLRVRVSSPRLIPLIDRQCVFFGSHFDLLLNEQWFQRDCRYGAAYFHGRPGQGIKEFDLCYTNLEKYHGQISRLQVSHAAMLEVVLSTGIAPEKVFFIPIGINPTFFTPQTSELLRLARRKYKVPENAVVVGSFQKDGVGWGEGLEPKWPKGPEVFLEAVGILKKSIPNLFVLLSGPARGFVKEGLKKLGVPFQHCFLKHYPEIAQLYHCLDVYICASREEGGPKSVLESMACGVPLVTTRVGQAEDMVRHGHNGWMVEVGDAEGLATWAAHCLNHPEENERVIAAGLATAQKNTYEAQIPLWAKFFKGFVE